MGNSLKMLSPDHLDFGRTPKLAAKQVVEVAKGLSQAMGSLKRS